MFYSSQQVVFQEVPNEISIALSISGCQLGCNGCHSTQTWNKEYGEPLTQQKFKEILQRYSGLATCVLFYGGEWDSEFVDFLKISNESGYKTCLYTGLDIHEVDEGLITHLDYIKCGRYVKSLGGIENRGSNQRFYVIHKNESSARLEDRTDLFKPKDRGNND